jgi:hypothetical protein
MYRLSILLAVLLATCRAPSLVPAVAPDNQATYVRVNLLGYRAEDAKVAMVMSRGPVEGGFEVQDLATRDMVLSGDLAIVQAEPWAPFSHYYEADFSGLRAEGRYVFRAAGAESPAFPVGAEAYRGAHEDLLAFMRQQRCGFNPFFDRVCHTRDGMSFYGPMPDSTFIDASGGWHDAGDQLKYLITGSNATARMLLAFELAGAQFADAHDALGRAGSNGLPDVLDEAGWGLDWIRKLAAEPGALVHQVADDRDHRGWKLPHEDGVDYGWGPNSYRPAYFATGRPQGLREFQSEATGVSNLAGRSAAALAMAHRVWPVDTLLSGDALRLARALYAMGRAHEGFQQGNSWGAPYRYTERTWADDMEWGAAELFRVTGERAYLDDAVRYARLAGATSWMQHDSTGHYEFYPFVNVGHFALYPHVDEAFRDTLAAFYRDGIERSVARARTNPWGVGVPFLWCSNNLVSALITQILLYERMTGDTAYHDFMLRQRDWLLGRNPWGTSMFTGLPREGERPVDVHTSTWALTRVDVPGGLVDGPIDAGTWGRLIGIALTAPDEFADVQGDRVLYHDDIGDYATNEPTMDGTAGAVFWMAWFGR